MSDKIIKFPSRELDIEVDLDEYEWHEDVVRAVHTMLEMHVMGIVGTSDVEWEHVMDAALSVAMSAGLRAGIDKDELHDILATASIEEFEYDA